MLRVFCQFLRRDRRSAKSLAVRQRATFLRTTVCSTLSMFWDRTFVGPGERTNSTTTQAVLTTGLACFFIGVWRELVELEDLGAFRGRSPTRPTTRIHTVWAAFTVTRQ